MEPVIIGLCMMVLSPILLLVVYKFGSTVKNNGEFIGIMTVIVSIMLLYLGYNIFDKAIVELGWWG